MTAIVKSKNFEDLPAEEKTFYENEKASEEQANKDLKASAKTKLMAGEPLTEEEADVMIGG